MLRRRGGTELSVQYVCRGLQKGGAKGIRKEAMNMEAELE